MYKRNCPKCNHETLFKSKNAYTRAIDSNRLCRLCSLRNNLQKYKNDVTLGIKENGFKGKHHTDGLKNKFRIERTGKKVHNKESKNKIRLATEGVNNPMYNRSFYDIWVSKYGKDIADQKLIKFKSKIKKVTSGKNNPMYGRPSPQGSGNGWKGWYKGIFFRSILELSFLISYVDRFKMKMESGEKAKYAIQYKDYLGSDRTYFPDYIINNKYMVEIKPKKLINTPLIKAKTKYAVKWCKKNGLKYKIITPVKLDETIIKKLHINNIIKFTESYERKYREQHS